MRKPVIILLLLFSILLFGQNFEGDIIYEIKYFRVDNGEEVKQRKIRDKEFKLPKHKVLA
ncbi:hypothetical protein [Siansivirga zeaxanthinifaciens]|uniref:Uncharacterized protein n=1 Tax=Siansivirga zeaxanthinifaciens CC-SAMT-1 TaxID=1454006 RepID=A0A0C5WI24_9FLAO|nr:hypothetical protein [Siansivirga zeaxanthinifaciens]AJR04814.1 hypothetical protein AW14_06570 [Siansivirga zeaxanthinifaciens CC-SAMT-1]